jgi:chemotaxis protein methyltransferase CheR
MSNAISSAEFKLLRDYIAEHSGIFLEEEKAYLLDTRLYGLLAETGSSDFTGLHKKAVSDSTKTLRNRIIDAMTTNETLWFRDEHPFTILKEKLVPPLAASLRSGARSRIRIWSAASSTGQEPYSIAMTMRELCRTESGLRPDNIEIVATDISPTALEFARAGRYSESDLNRGLPAEFRSRYFRADGDRWTVDQEIKDMITFRLFNLMDSPMGLAPFDVVFCRYVAIYFTPEKKSRLYDGIAGTLNPEGALIISAIENLRGVSTLFEAIEHAGGTYYRRL